MTEQKPSPEPIKRRNVAQHIIEAFQDKPVGHVMRVSEIAQSYSKEYGDDHPAFGAVSAMLQSKRPKDRLPGIETVTLSDGRLGAKKVATDSSETVKHIVLKDGHPPLDSLHIEARARARIKYEPSSFASADYGTPLLGMPITSKLDAANEYRLCIIDDAEQLDYALGLTTNPYSEEGEGDPLQDQYVFTYWEIVLVDDEGTVWSKVIESPVTTLSADSPVTQEIEAYLEASSCIAHGRKNCLRAECNSPAKEA